MAQNAHDAQNVQHGQYVQDDQNTHNGQNVQDAQSRQAAQIMADPNPPDIPVYWPLDFRGQLRSEYIESVQKRLRDKKWKWHALLILVSFGFDIEKMQAETKVRIKPSLVLAAGFALHQWLSPVGLDDQHLWKRLLPFINPDLTSQKVANVDFEIMKNDKEVRSTHFEEAFREIFDYYNLNDGDKVVVVFHTHHIDVWQRRWRPPVKDADGSGAW